MYIFVNLQLKLASSSNRSHYWKLEMANNENLSAAPMQITVQEVTRLFLRAPPNAFALFNFLRCIKKTRSSSDIYPAVPVNTGIFKSQLTIYEHRLYPLFDLCRSLSKYFSSSRYGKLFQRIHVHNYSLFPFTSISRSLAFAMANRSFTIEFTINSNYFKYHSNCWVTLEY